MGMTEQGKRSFDLGWRFTLSDDLDYSRPDFDDSSWRALDVPHDWSIEGSYCRENPSGKRGGFLPTGIGWYRKTWEISHVNRTFFVFDGIYRNSRVWINGIEVFHCPYGFQSFRFEATDYLSAGINSIAVRVDDSNAPSSRWYNGCGIYRHTWIIEKGEAYLLPDSFIHVISADLEEAVLSVAYDVTGGSSVTASLQDQAGVVVSEVSGPACKNQESLRVRAPHLWSTDTPYLYKMRIILRDEQGGTLDKQEWPVGIRTLDFRSDSGLFLNGSHIKLQGICMHHDAGGLGAAVPERILKKRLLQLKAGGVNTIRTGHTPFAPEFYDFCDELGLMVMDEMFDGWHKKAPYDYGALCFHDRGKKDLASFLLRDRNHACVIMWGIGNETGDTDLYGLTDLCHELDPTRPVSGGQLLFGVDVIGLNGPSETPEYLETLLMQTQDRPVLLSEYPHCYSTRGFYRTKTWWRDYGRARFDIPDYTETELFSDFEPRFSNIICYNSSYDNATCRISAKQAWARAREFEQVIGMFMWTGYDYLGESFGWPYRSNNSGIIDLAGFEKDIYYFYQSQWTTKPMVHLLPGWNLDLAEGTLVPVVVYSNCDEVELLLNGRALGRRRRYGAMELCWHVPYHPGKLEAVAYCDSGVTVRDSRITHGSPARLEVLSEDCLKLDGRDVVDLVVKARDQEGHFCANADCRVFVHAEGSAKIRGLENGDPFDLQSHQEKNRKLFYGMEKLYLASDGGQVPPVLTACAVMGDSYFKESAVCAISVVQGVTGGEFLALQVPIYYTTDGGESLDGIPYKTPFVITDSCVIRAAAFINGAPVYFEGEFVKGTKVQLAEEMKPPHDEQLLGAWEHDAEKMVFFQNGMADILKAGVKIREASWWYEEPADQFENDTGDMDNGEVLFPFENFMLKLMEDGRLRVRKKEDKLNSVRYFKKTGRD